MENFANLMHGFDIAFSFYHLMLMAGGVMLGILVGVLPGLGAPNGVSLLLPLTFTMDPVSAIILLTSMYWGALFGGSTTSIVITLLSSWVTGFALKFSSPEYFAVYLLTFASFIGMGSASPFKAIVSMMLGFAFATVGMDGVSGNVRLTFGYSELIKGISFLVAVIGLFGLGELLQTMEEGLRFDGIHARIKVRDVFKAIASLPKHWVTLVRSALIGCWMGITPGGPTAASFMSYGLAKRFSRNPENFGKGEPDGIIAPETADHSAGSCAILPMMALGVPGSATSAVMMGGLMIWGLTPGPMLFIERPDFVWGTIASMYLGNVMAVVLVLATVPFFAAILRIPFSIIGPMIVVVCIIGAYTISGSQLDLWLALPFGIIGYAFKKLDYPIAPMVLAMVLGDKAEDAFRQSMMMSKGSLSIFWNNSTLVACIMTLAMLLLFWPLIAKMIRRLRGVVA